jgi:hypothetical protein
MLLAIVSGCLGADLDDLDLDDLDVTVDGDLNPDLVEVEAYQRADGTWVESHVRTAPDDITSNNLGFWDLINA